MCLCEPVIFLLLFFFKSAFTIVVELQIYFWVRERDLKQFRENKEYLRQLLEVYSLLVLYEILFLSLLRNSF